MVGQPAEPPPPGQPSQSDPQIDAREPSRLGERSGPVAIARHVKDDGRALILYTLDDPPPT